MIVGIDEVGRGCWAGPLVAGAVLLPEDYAAPEQAAWRLSDSKVLSKAARQAASMGIRDVAPAIGLGWVSSEEVDVIGLTEAVRLAMRRALQEIALPYDEVIIDGNINYLADVPGSRAMVKADASVAAVSAASIMAKVARDAWMAEVAAVQFPGYGFESHVGYGTKQHMLALQQQGVCSLHRRSFRPVRQFC